MKLEDQVCSLDLAKRLKELGFPQEAQFIWHDAEIPGLQLLRWSELSPEAQKYGEFVAAPMVAELGEMLPANYVSGRWENGFWYCQSIYESESKNVWQSDHSEASARAEAWIYLREFNLIPAPGSRKEEG